MDLKNIKKECEKINTDIKRIEEVKNREGFLMGYSVESVLFPNLKEKSLIFAFLCFEKKQILKEIINQIQEIKTHLLSKKLNKKLNKDEEIYLKEFNKIKQEVLKNGNSKKE
jgi:hypothetical protein